MELPSLAADPGARMPNILYAETLLANMGVRVDFSPERSLAINQATDRRQVNRIVYDMVEELKSSAVFAREALSQEAKAELDEFLHKKHTDEAARLRSHVDSRIARAREYNNSATSMLREAMSYQRQLDAILGPQAISLTDAVEEAMEDRWWTFDWEDTKRRNKGKNEDGRCLVFTTPKVVINWRHPEGHEISVDMGQYAAVWTPSRADLKVYKHKENCITDNGFYHPHIYTDGAVCWGNGFTMHSQAMTDMRPAASLKALKSILMTYNEESPYERIGKFAVIRTPEIASKFGTYFERYDEDAWVYDEVFENVKERDILEEDEVDCGEDDDGDTVWRQARRIKIFRKRSSLDQSLADNGFYYRRGNNTYTEFDADDTSICRRLESRDDED